MSSLAQVLLAQGHSVSGSDRYLDNGENSQIFAKLRASGIKLFHQDGSGVEQGIVSLVASSAIEKDNPDLVAAQRLQIPVIHRAEMLAFLANEHNLVAVAGTSGKTTVTGMIGWILEQAGKDPTVINGGVVLNWRTESSIGNMRAGRSDIWVIEADESDRSLMCFEPNLVVITNISKDHFELAEAKSLFEAFAKKAKYSVTGCLNHEDSQELIENFKPDLDAAGSSFQYKGIAFRLSLPGRHNAENALHSIMLCEKFGVELSDISKALVRFKGIERRMEKVGIAKGVSVVDDHAHNPAKIHAAWNAVKPFHKRVIAVWRPHGYRPLAMMAEELTDTFCRITGSSDRLFILPVYFAGGSAEKVIDSKVFVEQLKSKDVVAEYIADYDELMHRLISCAGNDDVVLFMGARDPYLPVFALRFLSELSHLIV